MPVRGGFPNELDYGTIPVSGRRLQVWKLHEKGARLVIPPRLHLPNLLIESNHGEGDKDE